MHIKRILIIRFSSLGDIILLTCLFKEVKKCFPDADIDFLTSTTFSQVCSNNPHINRILALDRKKGSHEFTRIIDEVRQTEYDLVLDAHQSLRSRLLLIKAFGVVKKAKPLIARIDKRSFKRNLLLATKINLLKSTVSQRQVYCNLIEPYYKDSETDFTTELFPSKEDTDKISQYFKDSGFGQKKIVAIGPSASFKGKSWPKQSYLDLCEGLLSRDIGVLLVGGPGDEEPFWIESQLENKVTNFAGKLSYLETAALLKQCDLSISNDSAIIHFSEAVNTPALAIFGPTVKEFGYGPYRDKSRLIEIDLSCRPCSRNGKGDCKIKEKRKCLKGITVDSVLNHALNVLSNCPS